MKQKAAHGHAKKQSGTKKHAAAGGKHHPAHQHAHHQPAKAQHPKTAHTKAKHPHHTKARQLSPGYDVACCSVEALAASLRLSGRPVSADDVFALYWRTARDPDAGASILATLEAAAEFGLAGVRPVGFALVDVLKQGEPFLRGCFKLGRPAGIRDERDLHVRPVHTASVILGLELPGPHAVCQQDGQWWTWGEPYDPDCFPDAVIEEAWAVTWP